jgi:hypothetical protein
MVSASSIDDGPTETERSKFEWRIKRSRWVIEFFQIWNEKSRLRTYYDQDWICSSQMLDWRVYYWITWNIEIKVSGRRKNIR